MGMSEFGDQDGCCCECEGDFKVDNQMVINEEVNGSICILYNYIEYYDDVVDGDRMFVVKMIGDLS